MLLTALARAARHGAIALRFLFVAYTQADVVLAVAATLLGLGTAWTISYGAGGSCTPLPHLFYLPIILAAVRLSWLGATATAVAAGLLAGPALPAEVASHTSQDVGEWLLRTVMFLAIGLFVASLMRGRSEPNRRALQDSVTSARMLRALNRGSIEVFYQPLYRLGDEELVGFEALARWHDPKRGQIRPEEFISAAERTGAVAALDSYVLRTAARQGRQWADGGQPLVVSVNVSATRFGRCDLRDEVEQVLLATGLPARSLQLEITESALINDLANAAEQVAQLRALGVKLAIDDFGTGQASLNYLDKFEVDTIKLDRSLITAAASRPRALGLLTGLVRLSNDLNLHVVAEGIETEQQRAVLRDAGVHFGQGFVLGRPASAHDTEILLRKLSSANQVTTAQE